MTNPIDARPRRDEGCLSDFALDRLRTGELVGSSEGDHAAAHLDTCQRCRSRVSEMDAVVAPALDFGTASASRQSAPKPRRAWRMRAAWIVPVLAAAALVVLVPRWKAGERSKGPSAHDRATPELRVLAKRGNAEVFRVAPGGALAPKDLVRFEVLVPEDAYVLVISLDSDGAVTPFAPDTGNALAVRGGKPQLLDGAVELGDNLGPERMMLLSCSRPVAIAEAVAAGRTALERSHGHIESVRDLDLPCTQTSFWIQKEARP
jgi:hypothetical protein